MLARFLLVIASADVKESDAAWEYVDELEAELAFLKGQRLETTARQQFGEVQPTATASG